MRRILFSATIALSSLFSLPAHAVIVNIEAGPTGYGCNQCFGGPLNGSLDANDLVSFVNQGHSGPLTLTLGPGTYSIENGATSGQFSAWNYNVVTPPSWVWSFVIAKDNGNNTGNVLYTGWINAVPTSTQAGTAGLTNIATMRFNTVINPSTSVANFYDEFTLT